MAGWFSIESSGRQGLEPSGSLAVCFRLLFLLDLVASGLCLQDPEQIRYDQGPTEMFRMPHAVFSFLFAQRRSDSGAVEVPEEAKL